MIVCASKHTMNITLLDWNWLLLCAPLHYILHRRLLYSIPPSGSQSSSTRIFFRHMSSYIDVREYTRMMDDDTASVTFEPNAASVVSRNGIELQRQQQCQNQYASILLTFLSPVFTIVENSRRMIATSIGDSAWYGGYTCTGPSEAPSEITSQSPSHLPSIYPASSVRTLSYNGNAMVKNFLLDKMIEEDGFFGSAPYLLIGLMICIFVGVLHITRWRPTYGIFREIRSSNGDNRSYHGGEFQWSQGMPEELGEHNPSQDDEEENLNKYFLTRIGVGVHKEYDATSDHNAAEESSSLSVEADRAFTSGSIHSLVFEFADGSRTGKIFDTDGKCELSLLDQAVVEKRIGPLNCSESWHEVKEHDYVTHIAGSRGNSSDCIFEHITLFTSTDQIFSFGNDGTDFIQEGADSIDGNGNVSNNFNVEIPNTREAIRNIFSVPEVGIPVIVRDVGQRLVSILLLLGTILSRLITFQIMLILSLNK